MALRTDRSRILEIASRQGGVTTRDVAAAGIHRQVLSRLARSGELERVARGQYRLPATPVTEHHGLAVTAAAAPDDGFCATQPRQQEVA